MSRPTSNPERPSLWTAPFIWLTGAHFLQALGYATMILLPRYLDVLGASRAEVGMVMGAAAVGGLGARPAVGWALDSFGRKPTLVVGTLFMVAGMFAIGFVDSVGWFVVAARIVFGVGMGALFSGYFTFAADLVPASRRTEGLALFGVSGLLPLVANPVADRFGVEGAEIRWFLPLVGLAILGSLFCLRQVPETEGRRREPLRLQAVWAAFRDRALWSVWLADAVFSGMVSVFMAFCLVVGADRGVEGVTDLWLTYALGAVLVRVFGASLPERVGPSKVLFPALLSYVAGVALVATSTTTAGFLWAGLFAGLGHGYCFPILSAQLVTRTPDDVRGSAMAMFTGMWDVTKLLLPPVFGLVADTAGDGVMMGSAAAMGLVGAVLWVVLERTAPTSEAQPPSHPG